MLGGTGEPRTRQPLAGTHLQCLALGPLLAQLLPQVLQVPPATCQDGSAGARTSPKRDPLGTPWQPHPHSQVLGSHQVHKDVQGPDLSLQVLQGQ